MRNVEWRRRCFSKIQPKQKRHQMSSPNWGNKSKSCSKSIARSTRNYRIWPRRPMIKSKSCCTWSPIMRQIWSFLMHCWLQCLKSQISTRLSRSPHGMKIVKSGPCLHSSSPTRNRMCPSPPLMGSSALNKSGMSAQFSLMASSATLSLKAAS